MGKKVVLGRRIPKNDSSVNSSTQYIIYRQIRAVYYKDKPKKGRNYLDIIYSNDLDGIKTQDIDAFIATLVPYDRGSAPFLPATSSPLDLNCKTDCYVVFMLSSDLNWQFSTSGDAFLTKDDEGSRYYGLTHVMSDGTKVPGREPLEDGCRLLYLRARCGDYGYRDGFNLLIDLVLDPVLNPGTGKMEERRTKIIIDPDIRNPGGSGGSRKLKGRGSGAGTGKDAMKDSKKALRKNSRKRLAK